ncbi:hypothetical protein ACFC00_26930 [Streptomyces adustus]|uniref:hypothetical protein n=1 Tax=Streptomyces adustus TaxID=1609272 RepID=UPI0035E1F2F4
MFSTTKATPAPLGGPASIVIVVLIVITAVLVISGIPPLVTLTLTSGAGATGAMVVRATTGAPVSNMLRRTLAAVQAYGAA